jgi:hypothetical protein
MREDVKVEEAMENATSWPRRSTLNKPHTSSRYPLLLFSLI